MNEIFDSIDGLDSRLTEAECSEVMNSLGREVENTWAET